MIDTYIIDKVFINKRKVKTVHLNLERIQIKGVKNQCY